VQPDSPPTAAVPSRDLGFDLSIDPNPRFVSIVRRFVEDALARLLLDPACVCQVAMSAHELLENATKYAIGGKALLRVSFTRDGDQADVSLYLANETTPRHIGRLRDQVTAIASAADPFAHYQRLMRQSARSTEESGLGLARIRAEGDMILALEVKGSSVALLATLHLPASALR
jgi:two-component sensor histidine kinase